MTGNAGDNANNGNNNNNNILNYKQYETDNSANECVSVVWKSIGRHPIRGHARAILHYVITLQQLTKVFIIRSIVLYCNTQSKVHDNNIIIIIYLLLVASRRNVYTKYNG